MANILSRAEKFVSGGWTPAQIPSLAGKVALVTGANSGMGYEVTRKLAENGAKVLMVSKDRKKAEDARRRIVDEVGKKADLQVLNCDFMSLRNVADLASQVKQETDRLDLLVNMAGIFYGPLPALKTAEGMEATLGVNYYAHALLTLQLLEMIRKTPNARVVFMASGVMLIGQGPNWDHLTGDNYVDSGIIPYGTSKMYITMFAKELAQRVPEIDVFCVHPGLVATPLHKKSDPRYPLNLAFKAITPFLGQDPYHGAYSTLYAGTEPSLTGKHFAFYAPQLALLNWFPCTDRTGFYVSGRVAKRENTRRLFDATQDILHQVLGDQAPPKLGVTAQQRGKVASSA